MMEILPDFENLNCIILIIYYNNIMSLALLSTLSYKMVTTEALRAWAVCSGLNCSGAVVLS